MKIAINEMQEEITFTKNIVKMLNVKIKSADSDEERDYYIKKREIDSQRIKSYKKAIKCLKNNIT